MMKKSKKRGEGPIRDGPFLRDRGASMSNISSIDEDIRRRTETKIYEDSLVAHRKRSIFFHQLRTRRRQRHEDNRHSQKITSLLVETFAKCFGSSKERNDCFARSETCEVNHKLDNTGNCPEIGLSGEGSISEACVQDNRFFSLRHVMENQVPRSPSESSPTCSTELEVPRKLSSDPGSHCVKPVCIQAQMVMVTNDHDSSQSDHVYYELRPQWLQRCVEELNDCTDGSPLHPQHPLHIPICKEINKNAG